MDTLRTDVLIIGAGLAGHCAAIEAAGAGAQTLLLEKQGVIGGSTVLSGGSFAFADTDHQRRAGIKDSEDLLYQDLRQVGGEKNDPALVRLYVERQLDTYRWLVERKITFGPIQVSSGQSAPRLHPTQPRDVIRLLSEDLARLPNAKVICNASVKKLIRNSESEPVAGATAVIDGRETKISASKGVVLTSGGFARNSALIDMFVPEQKDALRIGGPGNTGDGLRMAWRLGAGFRDVGFIKGSFGSHPTAGSEQHTAMLAVYKGAIAINKAGKRFVNEALSYKTLGDAVLRQPGAIGYQIFDRTIMDQAVDGVPIFDFQRRVREGLLLSAGTLDELAKMIDVPPDELKKTVSDYNRSVAARHDPEFGRAGLSLGYGELSPIEHAPFYAYPSTSGIIATYCGLTIDIQMRVLDVDGAPIGNLFAAGEVTGGFHGEAYMTGSSLGKSSICGRLAGRNVATGVN